MIILVTLSDAEAATIRLIANLRTVVNRCKNIVPTPYGTKKTTADAVDLDEQGLIGEFAFCKYWNIFLDITPTPNWRPDCVLNGKSFDIKSTHYKNGKLIKKCVENNESDCYALAIVDGNTVTFPGWAFHYELCQEKNIEDGHYPHYALEQSKLRQWKDK